VPRSGGIPAPCSRPAIAHTIYAVATCSACGEENSERARFCQACGTGLQAAHTDESRRTVTVIFSDVVGSTALAEQLDTETFSMVMGLYFEQMSGVAERHGGTVAKFIGDAIVVVFGVPALHEDDALRAVKTAWEMREALDRLNNELTRRWDVTLASKTGINSGEVLTTTTQWGRDGVGRAVADRGGHVAIGDAMNIGARLEQAAAAGEIILGESTYRLVRGAVEAERLPPMPLKGKAEPRPAYRLLGVATDTEPLARHLDSPMVGRRDDLATLEWAFGRATRTQGSRVVTILGPAGVGKTRLAQEFVERIGDSAIVLQGRCLSYGEGITFWPIAEMVKSAAGITDADTQEQATAKIAALLSGDRDAIEAAKGVSQAIGLTTDEGAPGDTFWSLRRFMGGLAHARPLILVFEDIHWAERTLLNLIESIAEWTLDLPILIVCTARPELLDDRPDWNDPKRYETTKIALAPLAEGEAERLVRNLVGDGDLDVSTTDAIVEASGGNPLFMEQMVSMLVDEGHLEYGDLSSGTGAKEIVIPPTIQALIAARLDRLDPVERRVLGTASVVGRVFYRDAVSVLSNGDGAALGSSLMTLIRRQLIEPSASDIGG
jgi:class 3 adenylate cyclase